MSTPWYAKTVEEAFSSLGATEAGLSAAEAKKRLEQQGKNELPAPKVDGLPIIFLRQFQSPLIYVLFGASATVFLLGKTMDAGIILGVLLINAVIGTIQEGRAQNTLRALRNFVETKATVLRDGDETVVTDTELVPGDVVLLQEGERVPADARVVFSNALKIEEAALTGESTPVHKMVEPLVGANLPATEQKNMLFKGTYVVAGGGTALVTATGGRTVIGSIAREVAAIDTEVPLKKNIRSLSKFIIAVAALLGTAIFAFGLWGGRDPIEMFATVVALVVAIIPEGLPVVITLVLAAGVWRMSKRNALVKKLQAVEALGQARIIAVDKTGTITKNELVVERVWLPTGEFGIGGVGYEPKGDVYFGGEPVDPANHPELLFMGKIAAFCANARVIYSQTEKRYRVSGDPTEAAMLVLGQKLGFHKEVLEGEVPLVAEIPFDYQHKYHGTLHKGKKERFLTVVGAPEVVLAKAKRMRRGGRSVLISAAKRRELEQVITQLSARGLRVVGVAENRSLKSDTLDAEALPDLTFVGFFGMKDALRKEVAQAMRDASEAGIRVVMITGDHRATAQALAREAGIFKEGDHILTGPDIEPLSARELAAKLKGVSVFARVTPQHKLHIIEAYRARGEVVAMTGDGVNDAPSLVAADLGVAMGGIGTEVAREASDIVLLDDNFGSIVAAVEEGRNMYQAIKRVVLYLFSTSAGGVLTIIGAMVLVLPLPLLPSQIIWLNFVTGPLLDVALGMEPKGEGLLRGSFEKPKKYLVDGLMAQRIVLMALTIAACGLFLFSQYAQSDLSKALTMTLCVLAVVQWFNIWNCRSESESVFAHNPLRSPLLIGATAIVVGLQMLAVYHPLFQTVLGTVPLTLGDWMLIVPVALSIIVVEEVRKFFYRARQRSLSEVHPRFSARSV
jgi:P-type Ca2+ transporter type 2C